MEKKLYYYCHHESACVWMTDNPNEKGDGLVEQIDVDTFDNLDAMGYANHGYTGKTMIYAGIGARSTPPDVIDIMMRWARLLVDRGYTCKTGACNGADQAFANAALETSVGMVHLYIPWRSYEEKWWSVHQHVSGKYAVKVTVFDRNTHQLAFNSVAQFHPTYTSLKSSVVALHARNYLIVEGVEFVICWSPGGAVVGGTGQALRICAHLGIPIFNLGDPYTYASTTAWLTELGF